MPSNFLGLFRDSIEFIGNFKRLIDAVCRIWDHESPTDLNFNQAELGQINIRAKAIVLFFYVNISFILSHVYSYLSVSI